MVGTNHVASGAPQPNGIGINHSSYMQHHPVAVPVSLAQASATAVVPSNPTSGLGQANGASPPMSAASTKGVAGALGSPRSPMSGSEGRSSRSSFRDSAAHVQAPPSSAASVHARSDYARDMRERELGHGGMRQAVTVNGRGYGY